MLPSSLNTDLTIIVNMCIFNSLFNGKSSSVSILIFVKSFPCLHPLEFHSASFVFSVLFLISSQSSLYFLILLCFHLKNQKLNISSIAFFNMSNYFTKHLHYNYFTLIYTINIFIIINVFNCNVANVVNTNIFV